ncbi:hypothetical protein HN018_07005 [Lichenicola cladoniae]|uniref:Uncharacterized protein n=1 Tax=Lichenicola cladoniae TaxID=1484109 RepID=A0A6M8HN22_9PROT|nr:hypothetical protein [Lichenicola cladoniae]NPD67322.1 hypothetical protein [Acetobacteraceae bacterium]QKE89823.1 hypothetical protein HN018_07005 [Lichenicola cladoniae]
MSSGSGDTSIVLTLVQAGAFTTSITAIGGAIAWLIGRRDKRRAEKLAGERRDEDEIGEERKFYDERARNEIARIELEREAARAECRACHAQREVLVRRNFEDRESWLECLHEARRCQQILIAVYLSPPVPGQPPPVFDLLPDPRRRADPA